MDKTTIVKRIKTLLSIDTQLESYTLDDGTVFQADSLDVGNVLYLVTPDGVVPASEGDYVFGDWTVKVGEEGKIETSTQAESESAADAAAAEEPAEVEAEETPAEPEADPEPDVAPVVSLEEHNALAQRITDLEEVVETLTDALSQFRLETPAVEAAEEDPKPASKVVEVEFEEKPKHRQSTTDKVFNRINSVQFADA